MPYATWDCLCVSYGGSHLSLSSAESLNSGHGRVVSGVNARVWLQGAVERLCERQGCHQSSLRDE